VEPGEPLEDPAVLEAARAYAGDRFRQGLAAPDVALEFRLLHREVGRALRLHLADSTPTRDVVSAELLLNDGLDGAAYLALSSLGEHEAARHESEPDLASQPTFSWPENVVDRRAVERLAEALAERDLRERGRAGVPARILLDLDGTDDPAHGNQGGGGIDPTDAAWMLGLVSLVAIPGQIALGYLSDRIGRRSVWLAGSLGFALCYAALLLLQRSPTLPLLWVMVVAQGTLGYGLTSVIGAIPAETFPGRHHGTICGSLILASICGGAAGPWLTGTLYDLTGSYVPAFWIAIGVSVLGAVAVWIAAPPARPSSPSDPIRQREGAG